MGTRQLKTDLFLTWLPSIDVVFIGLACPLPAHATLSLSQGSSAKAPPASHPAEFQEAPGPFLFTPDLWTRCREADM